MRLLFSLGRQAVFWLDAVVHERADDVADVGERLSVSDQHNGRLGGV